MRLIRPRNFNQRAKRAGLDENDFAEVKGAVGTAEPWAGDCGHGIRLKLPGRGKSGGARVIYAVVLRATALALLDVYAKSDQADLNAQERKIIAKLIREIEAGFES
jgi:hypothetical protein